VLPLMDAFLDPELKDQVIPGARQAMEEGVIDIFLQWPMWVFLDEMDAAYATFHALEQTPSQLNLSFLFARETDRFRADPRFEQHAKHIGLDVYWKRYGEPDRHRDIER
ncbi:MAG: hypothetical protein O7G84_09860, partial [Gammaproteobacteria bacterium]|nr:hypothetical protein [Gammaproteobacteria bacterium]